jgi:hypothetical protein
MRNSPGIEFAAAGQGKIQQQVAIAADDIRQHVHHSLGGFVLDIPLVVPVADACIGLPRIGFNGVGEPAFEIEDTRAFGAVFLALAVVYRLDPAAGRLALALYKCATRLRPYSSKGSAPSV